MFGKKDEKDGSTLSYTGATVLHLLTVGLATGEVVAREAITVHGVVGAANAAVVEEVVVVFEVVGSMVMVELMCVGVVGNGGCDGCNELVALVVVLELGWLV